MSSPDVCLIERLRKENQDQFFTLVRMHLSFLVDINTDDVDSSTDKPKQFRWNLIKKAKGNAQNSSQNNGSLRNASDGTCSFEDCVDGAYELIEFLSKEENVKQEGIFRRTGSLTRQQELRNLLLTGVSLDLDEGKFSVHDCASVLKGFLADLPQPLLMEQYYQIYCTLAGQYPPSAQDDTKLLTALQLLLLLLPPRHRRFLLRLLALLRTVADHEPSNRMSPDTLATMFTPHLLCPRKLSPGNFHADSLTLAPLVSYMIRHAALAVGAPAPLRTDVAAYFAARRPDESFSDRTAANTVYTFVDRHRTSAENETNPTDAALARLYAHIQALPPSQHKRRLIKQFNRQNGYGTPLQVQRTGKAAGSRSFGDSIKRHIFSKNRLIKTPKKGSESSISNAVEESSAKTPQLAEPSEVPHKTAALTHLASKMPGSDSEDSNSSAESTLSEPPNPSSRRSPQFASEPNLSALDGDETPRNAKAKRLFRAKAGGQLSRRYQQRRVVRGTPTACGGADSSGDVTPTRAVDYLTSTPGVQFEETAYSIQFRRASMSPITKSTQKLSKAMQESIMTPRSRKPLIITSEQRESLPETKDSPMYQSISPNNDSDFVSSDDERSSQLDDVRTSQLDVRTSQLDENASVASAVRSESTRFVISHDRPAVNTTLCGDEILPKFTHEMSGKSLSEPFREYLLSRSVLTATPVDLSMVSSEDRISDSLLFCLDGNVPSDLAQPVGGLKCRSPLKNIDNVLDSSSRKRGNASKQEDFEAKKAMVVSGSLEVPLRETEL